MDAIGINVNTAGRCRYVLAFMTTCLIALTVIAGLSAGEVLSPYLFGCVNSAISTCALVGTFSLMSMICTVLAFIPYDPSKKEEQKDS